MKAREVQDKYFRPWLEETTQKIRLKFNGEVDRARPTGPTTWSIDRYDISPDLEPTLRIPLIEYELEPASSDTFIIRSRLTPAGELYAQTYPELLSVFAELESEIERFWPARGETGESVGEPCPGQPGDSPPTTKL